MSIQMRVKGYLLLMVCILITSLFYCIIGDPKPSLQNIVSESSLSQPLKRLKDVVVPAVADSSNYYLNSNHQADDELNEKYLVELGFVQPPRLWPANIWHNTSLPVFVSAVRSTTLDLAIGFVKSVNQVLPDNTLVLYDLGLDDAELLSISRHCNSSTCLLRKFAFDDFPSHVSDLKLHAFRPIAIQETLNQAGAVIWLDPDLHLIPSAAPLLATTVTEAQKVGVFSWTGSTIERPTSAMTHPKMFEYFHTQQRNYYFHRMVDSQSLVLFNTKRIHDELMRPWVKCALTNECIAPIGAQSSGCRFDKKPLFRYSGCHYYDNSALNVILGIMFDFKEKQYAPEKEKFFRSALLDDTTAEPSTVRTP